MLTHPALTVALRAARSGADTLRQFTISGRRPQIRHKGPTDYVTDVDVAIEEEVFSQIRQSYPRHSLLGEEVGMLRGQGPDAVHCWVLDPLDGTANFLHGFPHFCISLALESRGRLECAVIIDPMRSEEFIAVRGRGAYCNEERIRCSPLRGLDNSLVANSSHDSSWGGKLQHDNLGTIRQLYQHPLLMRRTGSVALDMAYVATGRLDGFWGSGLKHWDMAAGMLLVQEAGANSADYVNDEDDPRQTGRIICSAPGCFDALCGAVRDHLSS